MTGGQQIGWGVLGAALIGVAVWGLLSAWPFLQFMWAEAKIYLEDDNAHNDSDMA